MAKPNRIGILWKNRFDGPVFDSTCFYVMEEGNILSIIDHLLKSNGYDCINGENQKLKFLQDALDGKVTITYGINAKAEDDKYWDKDYLYADAMHSINNSRGDVTTFKCGNNNGRRGYGWKYQIHKERPLNDEEISLMKKMKEKIETNIKTDRVFNLNNFLLLCKNNNHITNNTAEAGYFGRVKNIISFDTFDTFSYKASTNVIHTTKSIIEKVYDAVKQATGFGLNLEQNNKIEFPEALLSSRCVNNEDFVLREISKEHKTMAEIYQELLDKSFIEKTVDMNMIDERNLIFDDSVMVIKNRYDQDLNGIPKSQIIKIPNCIATYFDTYGDTKEIGTLIIWGETKELYEALGMKEFINILKQSGQH